MRSTKSFLRMGPKILNKQYMSFGICLSESKNENIMALISSTHNSKVFM